MSTEAEILMIRVRRWIFFFMVMLVLSGITAFPLETELKALVGADILPGFLQSWVSKVYWAIADTNEQYPFMAYGTDWLAFAHIVIATAFIGPYVDPIKNKWVIQFGMIACVMVIPFALIAGPIRQIPFYWQLLDCSFGVLGILPLWLVHRLINKLEVIKEERGKDAESKLAYYEQVLIPKLNSHANAH